MELRSLIICEDVRLELLNKFSAMGIFGDKIIFPQPRPPAGLLRLCLVWTIKGLRGLTEVPFRIRLIQGDQDIAPGVALTTAAHDPAEDEHNFISFFSPVFFTRFGPVRTVLEIRAGERSQDFEYEFAVRGHSPTATPSV